MTICVYESSIMYGEFSGIWQDTFRQWNSDLPAGQPEAFRFSGQSGLRRACGEGRTIHKRGEDKKVIKITDYGL